MVALEASPSVGTTRQSDLLALGDLVDETFKLALVANSPNLTKPTNLESIIKSGKQKGALVLSESLPLSCQVPVSGPSA